MSAWHKSLHLPKKIAAPSGNSQGSGVKNSAQNHKSVNAQQISAIRIKDDSGKMVEYQSSNDKCPVCNSERYLNPALRLLISPCYHKMCESCITRLFSLGSEPCPICGIKLRKTQFTAQTFENLGVEKDVAVRTRIGRIYNKRRDDFEDKVSWDNYLEEVEDISFSLLQGSPAEVEAAEQKMSEFETANSELIKSNQMIADEEARNLREEEKRDKAERDWRMKEARKEDLQIRETAREEQEGLMRELANTSANPVRVLAKAIRKKAKRLADEPSVHLYSSIPTPSIVKEQEEAPLDWDPLHMSESERAFHDLWNAQTAQISVIDKTTLVPPADWDWSMKRAEIAKTGGFLLNEAWDRILRLSLKNENEAGLSSSSA